MTKASNREAAKAIMTTDTRPKLVSRRVQVGGRPVTVTGIAKGAGMIRPDMATMLAYLATDAGLEPGLLQTCLERAVAPSFNSISVDGDTSTNDACVLLASGRGARIDGEQHQRGEGEPVACCHTQPRRADRRRRMRWIG